MSIYLNTKQCLVCYEQTGKKRNETLYWHEDPDTKQLWCWCNREGRAYSIYEYCAKANISLRDFLKQDFHFTQTNYNELNKMDWPKNFVPLFSSEAKLGRDYLESRKIKPTDNMYYDTQRKGIVFPYYYDQAFCGAQIRFIEPWTDDDGNVRKIDTLPGSRLGLLVYNWNQTHILPSTKAFVITEGAFNALAIQQALHSIYGALECPYRCVSLSGSGASQHHQDLFREQISSGKKVILAADSDKAGLKMLKKMKEASAITHAAFTGDDLFDWNDIYKETDDKSFVRWFLGRIKSV